MAIEKMQVELSEGQKLEVLKRFRTDYEKALAEVESELRDLLTRDAEAAFLAQYIKEQPEVKALRADPEVIAKLEQRREYLHQLIKVLAHYTPEQQELHVSAPAERIRRY